MAKLNPYLNFDGTCRQAMTFYHQCVGGNLDIQSAADSPMGDKTPDNLKNQVIHSALTSGDIVLFASDTMGMGAPIQGNNVILALNCDSEEEINDLFRKFAVGAQASRPLNKEFWGGIYGEVTDKFGIRWLFNYQPAPAG